MKKNIFLALSFCLAQFAGFTQTIPNGGFENWAMPNGYNVPGSWSTLNDYTSALSVYTCTKGTPGSPGSSYMKLISKSVAGVGVVPGIAVSGTLSPSTYAPVGGFPFAFHPTFFTGKWQFMGATTNDVGSVSVALTHFDALTGTRDTVAVAGQLLNGMEMSWVNFSMPFTYLNSNTADSCIIFLNASGPNPQATSYLYVDNLAFTIPSSVNELHADAGLSVYPNPVTDVLTVTWRNAPTTPVQLNVFNSLGQFVFNERFSPSSKVLLNTANFPSGVYYLRIQANDELSTIQFIVK
jgi:hypothetical protein